MPSMQLVFLFDLNAFTENHLKIGPALNKKLLCLRLSCLKILTHYFTIEPNLKWGFKFFDSRGSLSQSMCKFSFPSVSLDSFETLENEITVCYQRHHSYLDALSVSAQKDISAIINETNCKSDDTSKTFHPVQVLQLALTQILCEYQWSNQMTFFSPSKKSHSDKHMNKNDLLFLITKCPNNQELFSEYFGADYASMTAAKFAKILLSRSLHDQLLLKSSILWIWLSTNNESFIASSKSIGLGKISEMLNCLKCSLIPITALSYPPHIVKFEKDQNKTLKMDLLNSLLPFSSIISHSIPFAFYLPGITHSSNSIIHFQDKALSVNLSKILLKMDSKEIELLSQSGEEFSKTSKTTGLSITWSKFVVQFAVARKTYFNSCNNYLCLPSVPCEESNNEQFQNITKALILKDSSLFLVCESSSGMMMPGFFSPVTDTSAIISIISAKELFKTIENHPFEDKKASELRNSSDQASCDTSELSLGKLSNNPCLKPFQVECVEQWFEPSSSICAITPLETAENVPDLKLFYKKLSVKLSKHQKSSPQKENIIPSNETTESNSSKFSELFEVSGVSYEELIKMLTETYDLTLKQENSILFSAKKIVKSAYSFFQQKSSDSRSLEDNLKDFMTEFFYITNRKIIEKYDLVQDNDQTKRVLECQLQVLLAFEMEILFPTAERLNLIRNITSFLRSMSFYSGASELNKFLHEILKENYKDNLYDMLVEIGDELDIPIFEEDDDSPYEPSEPPSSESMLGSNNSLRSSTFSVKSSSSSSSRADKKKLIRKRSDINDNSKSRQFLLTKSSPKKKKYKNLCPGAENIPIRYSPRLSSRRKKERHQNTQINVSRVRRNLFPKDQKLCTPKYNYYGSPRFKRRTRTPKSHHVLKTNFVAETPTSKQNRSALQRRKSFMDTDDSETSLTEIAESPKIFKKAKDTAHSELLKQLNNLECKQFYQPRRQPTTSCSSYNTQYTPESKRRLSLKLFSKLMTSPTARMGLKKCTKRLFDQVSPRVESEMSKKPKLNSELKTESLENKILEKPEPETESKTDTVEKAPSSSSTEKS